jgi:hypothetical protein
VTAQEWKAILKDYDCSTKEELDNKLADDILRGLGYKYVA